MADYIIVLAVAIMVFSIASLFLFARGKFVEEDGKHVDKHAAKKKGTSKSIHKPDDQADDSLSSIPGESGDSTPQDT